MRLALGIVLASAMLAQTPVPSPFAAGGAGGGGSGTVTSVGLAGTANQITVTGTSPITSSGSWTLSFPTNMTLPGTTTGSFSGNVTGNLTGTASTATNALSLGGNLANTYAPLASPTFTGTVTIGTSFLNVPGLTSPSPTLTPAGADDGVTYSYFCVARSLYGPAAPGSTVTTTHGPTTLSSTDKISITCALTASAVNGCDVYRFAGGDTQGRVGNVACNGSTILADTGLVATNIYFPTTENTSGAIKNGVASYSVTSGGDSFSQPLSVVNISGDDTSPNLKAIQYSDCTDSDYGTYGIVAIGAYVGQAATYRNCGSILIGVGAGYTLTHDNFETIAIGSSASGGTHDNSDVIGIGLSANQGLTATNSGILAIGKRSGPGGANNSRVVAIGSFAGAGGTGTNDAITGIGYESLSNLGSGNNNLVAIGLESMQAGTKVNAANDVAVGTATLQQCTTCVGNVAIGDNAGFLVTTGTQNVLLGKETGKALTTQSGNVMIGYQAGMNATASNKLYIDNSNTATPLIGGDFSARTLTLTAATSATSWGTASNCSDSAGAAACGSAAAGAFVVDAAATSVVVSTTAVTANSEIFVFFDAGLGTRLGITCNATVPTVYGVTARTAGTSFTLGATAPAVNPACFSYSIVN